MNETAAVIKGPMVFAVFNPLNCSGFFFFFFWPHSESTRKYAERPNQELNSRALH